MRPTKNDRGKQPAHAVLVPSEARISGAHARRVPPKSSQPVEKNGGERRAPRRTRRPAGVIREEILKQFVRHRPGLVGESQSNRKNLSDAPTLETCIPNEKCKVLEGTVGRGGGTTERKKSEEGGGAHLEEESENSRVKENGNSGGSLEGLGFGAFQGRTLKSSTAITRLTRTRPHGGKIWTMPRISLRGGRNTTTEGYYRPKNPRETDRRQE